MRLQVLLDTESKANWEKVKGTETRPCMGQINQFLEMDERVWDWESCIIMGLKCVIKVFFAALTLRLAEDCILSLLIVIVINWTKSLN